MDNAQPASQGLPEMYSAEMVALPEYYPAPASGAVVPHAKTLSREQLHDLQAQQVEAWMCWRCVAPYKTLPNSHFYTSVPRQNAGVMLFLAWRMVWNTPAFPSKTWDKS